MKLVLCVRKNTRDMLKLSSVIYHESMVEMIDKLARQELARCQKEQENAVAARHEA